MDAKKGKTRKESTPIKVWVTPEEKAAIAAKADAHSLSASSYLRRLGLAMPLQSTIDQQAMLDLVKINADLGRFGELIKMWLNCLHSRNNVLPFALNLRGAAHIRK